MDTMDSQILATLQSLLTATGAADPEPFRLKPFYHHCARLPLAHDGKHVALPLKSLLLNYTHLRQDVKISLDNALHERWRVFAAETPLPLPSVAEDRPAPDPGPPPPTPALNDAPSDDSRPTARPVKEDWFDRFLNGVRCLLFL
jgi:hypothetical protein